MHQQILDATVQFVKEKLKDAEGGHDWWHIYRVWQNAKLIAEREKADLLTVELSALLHDIADAKFHEGNESIGPLQSRAFLQGAGVSEKIVNEVVFIVDNISYRKSLKGNVQKTLELCVVQDADRLDAVGAIGIARAFSYGGFRRRAIYDPNIVPHSGLTHKQYVESKAPTINHFYEKLLLLKDQMNTKTGKQMAAERHIFMEKYLEQFYLEWPDQVQGD